MPRIQISEQDVDPKNTDRLRRKLQNIYDQVYDQLGQIEKLKSDLASAKSGGMTPAERSILRALMLGSTQTAVPSQTAVIPVVSALPPTNQSTPGQLVDFSGTVYIFIDVTTGWITLTAAATAHNLLSTTHSDTLAGVPVLGDLIHGNGTPKWARLAGQIAATQKFLTQTGTGAVSAVPAWFDLFGTVNTWSVEQLFSGATALGIGGGPNVHFAKHEFFLQDEEITLSTVALTTDSAGNLLLGASLILPLLIRITQTISGGGVTVWRIGDATQNDRFGADSATLASGSTFWGGTQWDGSVNTNAKGPTQAANAKIRITTDAIPTQGKIRVVSLCLVGTAPTS